MRTDLKVAIVLVLIIIIVAVGFFLIRAEPEGRIELGAQQQVAAKDRNEVPLLPEKPGVRIREKALRRTTPKPPREKTIPLIKPKPAEKDAITTVTTKKAPSIKVDIGALTKRRPTTQPAKRIGPVAIGKLPKSKPGQKFQPNQPVKIEIDLTSPTTRAEPPKPSGRKTRISTVKEKPKIYVVKPGDTLYGIAEEHYGRGELWVTIARANRQLTDPSKLLVGQKITLPPRKEAVLQFEGADQLPREVDRAGLRIYKVKPGESFYTIAKDQLGSPERWRELFDLNKSRVAGDPKKLRAGQTIFIPAK